MTHLIAYFPIKTVKYAFIPSKCFSSIWSCAVIYRLNYLDIHDSSKCLHLHM